MSKAASAAKAKASGALVRASRSPGRERGDQEADVVGLAVGDVGGGELLRGARGGREERALGRDVGGRGDREETAAGVDDPGRRLDGNGDRGEGDRDAAEGGAQDQQQPPRVPIAEQAGKRRGQRPGQQPDQGGDPDRGRAALVEGVDSERDREGPGRDGDSRPSRRSAAPGRDCRARRTSTPGRPAAAPWRFILIDRRRSRRRPGARVLGGQGQDGVRPRAGPGRRRRPPAARRRTRCRPPSCGSASSRRSRDSGAGRPAAVRSARRSGARRPRRRRSGRRGRTAGGTRSSGPA